MRPDDLVTQLLTGASSITNGPGDPSFGNLPPGYTNRVDIRDGSGVILVDEFDSEIFDDVFRSFPLWNRIMKMKAIGETTGGFNQSEIPDGKSVDVRNLAFQHQKTERFERPRRRVKAIKADREFGIFDRSLGMLSQRPWSNLVAKDVQDMYNGNMRRWSNLAYEGNTANNATRTSGAGLGETLLGIPAGGTNAGHQFEGLKGLLRDERVLVPHNRSIADVIDDELIRMVNQTAIDVMPTAIYTNAKVIQMIVREFEAVGDKLLAQQFSMPGGSRSIRMLPTSYGDLPLFPDPWNKPYTVGSNAATNLKIRQDGASGAGANRYVVAANTTRTMYPTYILTEPLVEWHYVPILGEETPDPRMFEIAMQNTLDVEYVSLMFGVLDLIGLNYKLTSSDARITRTAAESGTGQALSSGHHRRIDVVARDVAVSPGTQGS